MLAIIRNGVMIITHAIVSILHIMLVIITSFRVTIMSLACMANGRKLVIIIDEYYFSSKKRKIIIFKAHCFHRSLLFVSYLIIHYLS